MSGASGAGGQYCATDGRDLWLRSDELIGLPMPSAAPLGSLVWAAAILWNGGRR